MKQATFLVALFAGAFLAAQAQAQMAPMRASGGYAGAGVMTVHTDNAKEFANTFGGTGDDTATGLKVYAGYLWPSRFGIEVGYYDLGSYEVKNAGAKTDEFAVNAFTVSAVFATPIGRNFDFNAKLGIAFSNADYTCFTLCGGNFVNTSKSGTAGLLGAGVGWRIAPNFSLRADYEWFGGVKHAVGALEVDYGYGALSLSAQLKF